MSYSNHHLQSPAKRRRLSPPVDDTLLLGGLARQGHLGDFEDASDSRRPIASQSRMEKVGSITLSATAKLAGQTVAPFLLKHIPDQYAPMGGMDAAGSPKAKESNTKYCYRHRPDLKCRRQANEPSMEQLQHVSIGKDPLVASMS